jgi:hypothetical protein
MFFVGHEPALAMGDDHTPPFLVISPSGQNPIEFLVQSLHAVSGPPATQVSWLPSVYELGHAVHTEQNDLHWREVCMSHLTHDLVTPDADGHVSAPAPLQLGAAPFAFGESFARPRTVSPLTSSWSE